MSDKKQTYVRPLDSTMGMLHVKPLRGIGNGDIVVVCLHSHRLIYFWSNVDPAHYVLPDPMREYFVEQTAYKAEDLFTIN